MTVELNLQSADVRFILGLFLMQQRRYDDAILQLAKAVELSPDSPRPKIADEARGPCCEPKRRPLASE